MKSLKTVQSISKVVSIIVKIGYVFSIIGAVGALIGGVALLSVPYIGEDIARLIASEVEGATATALGIGLIAETIYLTGAAIGMGFTNQYFKNELKAGTPFTHNGAKELLRAGIINLAVLMGAYSICAVILAIAECESVLSIEYDAAAGIMMILLSFVFHYGADLSEGKREE